MTRSTTTVLALVGLSTFALGAAGCSMAPTYRFDKTATAPHTAGMPLAVATRNGAISISEHAIFAGTQDDAFARSYALINPTFEVNSFTGYCDPTAVFGDIEPNAEFSTERIDDLREYEKTLPFTQALNHAYTLAGNATEEAVFFIEQVTGHLIPDFKPALAKGITGLIAEIDAKIGNATPAKRSYYEAMKVSLESIVLLADRYAELAHEQQADATDQRKAALAVLDEQGSAIDIVLTDLIMPQLGGDALLAEMRARGLRTPVVILSGHPLEGELAELKQLGLAGWLLKPPDIKELAQLLASVRAA